MNTETKTTETTEKTVQIRNHRGELVTITVFEEDLSYIQFGVFTTYSGERRIYINGTTREKVYLTDGGGDAKSKSLPGWGFSSEALKGLGSKASIYDRQKKDLAAFTLARKALIARYGPEPTFDAVWTALAS